MSTPFCDLSPEVQDIILHGTNGHEVKVYYKESVERVSMTLHFEGLFVMYSVVIARIILNVREQNMKTL